MNAVHGGSGLLSSLLSGAGGTGTTVLIVAAVLAYLIYRQVVPRRLTGRSLVLVPLVLLCFVLQSLPHFQPSPTGLIDTVISAVVSLVLGLLAARQLRVYASPETGKAMAGGSWTYFLWWLAAFVLKAILAVALGETAFGSVSQVEILLPILLLVATRDAYLYWRAAQLGLALH